MEEKNVLPPSSVEMLCVMGKKGLLTVNDCDDEAASHADEREEKFRVFTKIFHFDFSFYLFMTSRHSPAISLFNDVRLSLR